MFIDQAHIHVQSGKGGDGVVSFRREKYVPRGGPDGGDGGDGGSVLFVADPQVNTLLDFTGRHHWHAANGQPGAGKQRHGRNGDDLEIHLPPGTLIYDDSTGELVVDLDTVGKKFTIAQGGRGGFGNEHFKSATNQVPQQATPGEPGQGFDLRLELKLIADVGLIGKPNAGKSTLLGRVSRATPKIGDYPFTTLEPQLGIAELPGSRRLVLADIPGLIEGASEGAGLGVRFLRHVERTKVLLHLLEVQPMDESDPVANYRAIRQELAAYAPGLACKHEIVALSKMDLLPPDQREAAVRRVASALGVRVIGFSAATGDNLPALLQACGQLLQDQQEHEHHDEGQSAGGECW